MSGQGTPVVDAFIDLRSPYSYLSSDLHANWSNAPG